MEPIILPADRIKRIHVNRQRIDQNRKRGEDEPTITVKMGGKNFYGREVIVMGETTISQKKKQLDCGARVYIETLAEVHVLP